MEYFLAGIYSLYLAKGFYNYKKEKTEIKTVKLARDIF